MRKMMILALAALLMMGGCGQAKTDSGETGGDSAAVQPETGEQENGNSEENSQEDGEQAQEALRAVYLKNDVGELFVALEQGTPFTGMLPEEIVDADGTAISGEDLQSGDVLDIYGSGIMTNSYPGQYAGITKLVRVEKANQEYVNEYQELLDQFFPEPDTTQPPELSVTYRQPEAVVTASCMRGGYEWSYTDENGETVSTVADSTHVLMWEDIPWLQIAEETEMTMAFTYEPDQVAVVCWKKNQQMEVKRTDGDSITKGETVRVDETEDGFVFTAKPDYIYQITGTWSEGTVEYGFGTTTEEKTEDNP